MLPFSVVYC